MKQIIHNNINYLTREGTLDEFVIKEGDYEKRCSYTAKDVWLDAGGNIGVFVCKYANKVDEIITFEPDDENFDLLKKNIKLNDIKNYKAFKAALVGNKDKTRDFYLNTKKNKGTHSLMVTRGRDKITVKCQNIDEVIKKYGVNKIKMDVEGAEYELLTSMDLDPIKEIVLEYHFNALKDHPGKEKYKEIITILENNFHELDFKMPEEINKHWTCIMYAKK